MPLCYKSFTGLVEIRMMESEIPDMNQEPPASLFASSTVNDRTLSGSKTESLNAEHLICYAEHLEETLNNTKSPKETFPLEVSSSSRWVKRFRLDASDSHAIGTKRRKLEGNERSDNANMLLGKIMNHYKATSEPATHIHQEKETVKSDKSSNLLGKRKQILVEAVKDKQIISLSHPWILRWRRREVSLQTKKPVPEVVCEPESSKIPFDQDFQAKAFPTIGGLALMGKAAFTLPCEFRRRGSLVVWKHE